jgi:peptidyl-prolyl cis-trans isomerase D
MTSKLFQLKAGDVATVAGADGHSIVELGEIVPAEPASNPDAVTELKKALGATMQNDVLDQLVASLQADYGVTVNQALLDDVLASF